MALAGDRQQAYRTGRDVRPLTDGGEPIDDDTKDTVSVRNEASENEGHLENVGNRFDRLPARASERIAQGRPTRTAVLEYFEDRFGIRQSVFDRYTFWEKGSGKIWIYAGRAPSPIEVQALGMTCLRTRQKYWKPTTNFVQRFGREAERNVIELGREAARAFVAGESVAVEWDGDWGYLIVAHEIGSNPAPLGVGLYVDGELRSMVPKGRRRVLE